MEKFLLIFLSALLFLFSCGNEPGNGRPLEQKSNPITTNPNPEKAESQIKEIPFN